MRINLFETSLAVAALLLGTLSASAQLNRADIEVLSVRGEVELLDDVGQEGKPKVGRLFKEGSRITTGANGNLKLALANGSRLVIEAESEVNLGLFRSSAKADTNGTSFANLSTDKEDGNSNVEIQVLRGSILVESTKLNLPVSYLTLRAAYFDARVLTTDSASVFRFEQGDDFGRLSVYKGVLQSKPHFIEFGPPVNVTEGRRVIYRFNKNTIREGVPLQENHSAGRNLADPDPGQTPGWEEASAFPKSEDLVIKIDNADGIDSTLKGLAASTGTDMPIDPHYESSGNGTVDL
jgi:hypothetical protein